MKTGAFSCVFPLSVLTAVSVQSPVSFGTGDFRGVRPDVWEGVSIYRDLKYGPRGDAPGEGAGYRSALTMRTPDGLWRQTHRTGQFCDVIVPAGGVAEDAPVYVHFHGGAWCQACDKDGESMWYLKRYADAGFVVVNADYMIPMDLLDGSRPLVRTPGATFLAILDDVDTLASWLKSDLLPAIGVRPTKFAIGGFSAGGHIAALYGYDQANPAHLNAGLRHEYPVGLVIDVVGPTDLASADFTRPFLKGEVGILDMFDDWAVDRLVTLLGWLTDDDLRARTRTREGVGGVSTGRGRLTSSPKSEIICGMEYEVRSMASYETRKFVDNIIRLLGRKGMTRQEFARRLDVRPSYVTKILSGSENFTVETMQKMAGIFGYQVVIGLRRMPHGTGKGLSAMEIKKRISKRKGVAA